jgi:hypothetical protein
MNDDTNNIRRNSSDDSTSGNDRHPSVERLSEFLDDSNDLDVPEREAISAHLASCQACQSVLTDLQLMVRTLGSLPEREAPRSFAITWNMMQPATSPVVPAPIVLQESAQWHARHAGKVRWATAVAAMLFVFVISADLMTNGLRGNPGVGNAGPEVSTMLQDSDADEDAGVFAADAAEPVPTAAAAEEAVPESADAPPSDAADMDDSGDADLRTTDGEVAEDEAEEITALSMETEDISDQPTSDLAASGSDSSHMRWRVIEVSLALVLALLLAVMIGLPRQRGTRRQ